MFDWDHYSDQPYIIKDKKLKREIYKKSLFDNIKLLFTNLLVFPFVMINFSLKTKSTKKIDDIFALGISLENHTPNTKRRVEELGVKKLLIRFPLSQMDKLKDYHDFIQSYSSHEILINLIQDRDHIEDKELLKNDVREVFKTFKSVKEYQVGTTINRKKWAFFSVDEYLKFYKVVQDLRDEEFKTLSLIGSSVIDFEYHFSIRSLFNFYKIHFDKFSSLLYVDRRGSPFNTQAGFDFLKKIDLLYSIVTLSPKTSNSIYITETNWPITKTAPYAPTSEKECVSLEDYSSYMVAYHLISLASKKIDRIYWHQLDAKGYGLVNHIEDKEYPAFLAYKVMINKLSQKNMIKYNIKNNIKVFEFDGLSVFYCEDGFDKSFVKDTDKDIYGKSYKSGKVIYRDG